MSLCWAWATSPKGLAIEGSGPNPPPTPGVSPHSLPVVTNPDPNTLCEVELADMPLSYEGDGKVPPLLQNDLFLALSCALEHNCIAVLRHLVERAAFLPMVAECTDLHIIGSVCIVSSLQRCLFSCGINRTMPLQLLRIKAKLLQHN